MRAQLGKTVSGRVTGSKGAQGACLPGGTGGEGPGGPGGGLEFPFKCGRKPLEDFMQEGYLIIFMFLNQ